MNKLKRLLLLRIVLTFLVLNLVFISSVSAGSDCFQGDCLLCLLKKAENDLLLTDYISKYNLEKSKIFLGNSYKGSGLEIKCITEAVQSVTIYPAEFSGNLPYTLNANPSARDLIILLGPPTDENWETYGRMNWKKEEKVEIYAEIESKKVVSIKFSGPDKDFTWTKCLPADGGPEALKVTSAKQTTFTPDKTGFNSPNSSEGSYEAQISSCIKAIQNNDDKMRETKTEDGWTFTSPLIPNAKFGKLSSIENTGISYVEYETMTEETNYNMARKHFDQLVKDFQVSMGEYYGLSGELSVIDGHTYETGAKTISAIDIIGFKEHESNISVYDMSIQLHTHVILELERVGGYFFTEKSWTVKVRISVDHS